MQFDTADLKIFVAAAEHGSLTSASNECHLALAAISKRIGKLEEQLGSALFIRSKSGVELTPGGRVFLGYARDWLYDLQLMNAELQEHAKGFRGLIRVAANTNAMLGFLPELAGNYLSTHKNVDIRIEEVLSTEVIRRVSEGRADIGIFAATVEANHLELFPFREDLLVAVMSSSHPLAARTSLGFEEIVDEDFVTLDKQAAIQTFLDEKARQLGKSLHVRVATRSFDAVARFAQCGFGIGIIPRSSSKRIFPSNDLTIIPLKDDWAIRHLKIAVRSMATLPTYARQLVEHLCPDGSKKNGSIPVASTTLHKRKPNEEYR